MKVIFRPMQIDDIECVYKIEKKIFTDPWSEKSFFFDLSDNKYSHSFILESKNIIIGYSICWYYYNELHIGNFAIHPDFHSFWFK